MIHRFKEHYKKNRRFIRKRLEEFRSLKNADDSVLLEEMAFCVFAANSSAKMGLLAVKLLKPVLKNGTIEDYKKCVYKKVRFYDKRAEYMHANRMKIVDLGGLRKNLDGLNNYSSRRSFIRDNFKGFGLKEASHFLRNIGYVGYCIVDKHILNTMHALGVLETNRPPKNEKEYLIIEDKIKEFAGKNGFDIDELDLALWSFETGEIIK